MVRTPDKAADLAALGVQVRRGDYTLPETLANALAGVDKLLLISSSEVGQRVAQHANAIAAAKSRGETVRARPLFIPRHLCQDIDTPEDWAVAERLYTAFFTDAAKAVP